MCVTIERTFCIIFVIMSEMNATPANIYRRSLILPVAFVHKKRHERPYRRRRRRQWLAKLQGFNVHSITKQFMEYSEETGRSPHMYCRFYETLEMNWVLVSCCPMGCLDSLLRRPSALSLGGPYRSVPTPRTLN